MPTKTLEPFDPAQRRNDVVSLIMTGKSEMAVAKELGITRVEVKNHFQEWKDIARNDRNVQDEARDHLNLMVKHFDKLISEAYRNLKNLKSLEFDEKISAQINATIKNIAEFEAKRVDALQKAGLLEGADLGDELAEMERQKDILIKILREDLCHDCQKTVARRLQEVTNVVEVIRVHDE